MLKLWRPGVFQGSKNAREYFEGWYFKLVDRDEKNILAVIPGVSYGKRPEEAHCFIQVMNGISRSSDYIRYGIAEFRPSGKRFEIRIGNSYFSSDRIVLDLDDGNTRLKGKLSLDGSCGWPVTLTSPGAMGRFAFVPLLECYHGILSFNPVISGSLETGGSTVDFTDGKGYMEKDWGRSFPSAWIWMQSNHFEDSAVCFTISVAKIPWFGSHFTGFIAGLKLGKQLYRFATYTGARLESVSYQNNTAAIVIRSGRHILEAKALMPDAGQLMSPKMGLMSGRIYESLTAKLDIRLVERRNKAVIFEGRGRNGGLEVTGNVKEIMPVK